MLPCPVAQRRGGVAMGEDQVVDALDSAEALVADRPESAGASRPPAPSPTPPPCAPEGRSRRAARSTTDRRRGRWSHGHRAAARARRRCPGRAGSSPRNRWRPGCGSASSKCSPRCRGSTLAARATSASATDARVYTHGGRHGHRQDLRRHRRPRPDRRGRPGHGGGTPAHAASRQGGGAARGARRHRGGARIALRARRGSRGRKRSSKSYRRACGSGS